MSSKRWNVRSLLNDSEYVKFPHIHSVVAQILHNRGLITQEQIDEFLRSDWHHDVYDPFLFTHMNRAVERVYRAIEGGERIVIYGDYDADGVTGTAILYTTLKRIGASDVVTYIPHREEEGYGLHVPAIDTLVRDGASLIISVDLGVSNIEQIEHAQACGVDVIVVDHHDLAQRDGEVILPAAVAIVHARIPDELYPFSHLCGAGTAFKFAQGLLSHSPEGHGAFEKWLLDLVAIGTVADIVPLVGENRTLVKLGLLVLSKTQRPGISALMQVAGIRHHETSVGSLRFFLDARRIAFQIAPRINAAGRMEHARIALDLLIEEDEERALGMAQQLNQLNQDRQRVSERMYKQALELIGEVDEDTHVLSAHHPEWPLGIVGLVAGKLSNEFYRPVLLTTRSHDGIAGSGRSIPEFDITAALSRTRHHLTRYGGHAAACGFSLLPDQFEAFVHAFRDIASRALAKTDLRPSLDIDMELDIHTIDDELVEQIESCGPFGEANGVPLFMSRGLKVQSFRTVGANNQHVRLRVSDARGQCAFQCIGFNGARSWLSLLHIGGTIDIVYELGFNEWNGTREIQLKVVDMR